MSIQYRMQKEKDRKTVIAQKEKNSHLEEEIERLNIEQQRLKEADNAVKVKIAEITRTIVVLTFSINTRIVWKSKLRMKTKLLQNWVIRLLFLLAN